MSNVTVLPASASSAATNQARPGDLAIEFKPTDAFRVSPTKSQAERRKRFCPIAMNELADSIKHAGVIQPIVARLAAVAADKKPLEIVLGERRWTAAIKAGLKVIPVVIRTLSDEEVVAFQLIENVQREKLHGLAELEAYEGMMKRPGYTPARIGLEVGKERKHVVQKLKLTAPCAAAREAYGKGKVSEDVAFMVARLPSEALQSQALKQALDDGSGEPMSTRNFSRFLQTNFMLRLKDAGFPTQDAKLIPAAGPCGSCPKRTGNQPELFLDVQGADVCTDPKCFSAKRAAYRAQQLASAKEAGRRIIEGKTAAEIAPWGPHNLQGYVRPTDRCHEDRRKRTYGEIVGKKETPALLVVPNSGEIVEVLERRRIAPLLKEAGASATPKTSDSERAQRAKLKKESAFRWKLFEAVHAKSPATLSRADLEQVATTMFAHHGYESRKRIFKVWGWDRANGKPIDSIHHDQVARSRVPKLSDAELARFLIDCLLVSELHVSAYVKNDGPERMLAAAKKLRIDVDAIRKDAESGGSPQGKLLPAKAAKANPPKAIRKSSRSLHA